MHALAAGGADIIELGVPFSDPMADGPIIQKASERALARGVGLTQVLQWVAEFRRTDAQTPVVLMGYANPIERFDLKGGEGAFVAAAADAGVDGVLVVDYPPEECEESFIGCAHGLDFRCLFPCGEGSGGAAPGPGLLIWPSAEASGALRFCGVEPGILQERTLRTTMVSHWADAPCAS
jgi:hypothetical protein